MNKKEEYDKKIEIIKKFLQADGNIESLTKIQKEIQDATITPELQSQQLKEDNEKIKK